MARKKLEEYLAPWEVDADGKKLDEPVDIDPEKLKKYIFNLLSDKEDLQDKVGDAETERDQVKNDLEELRRANENDEQRRAREDKEREQRYAAMEKREREREKVEALEKAFEDKGITSKQARLLAKRVQGENEKEWLEDATELVDNGFRVGEVKKATEKPADDDDDSDDDAGGGLRSRPVRRADGTPVVVPDKKPTSIAEQLDAAGIGRSSW